MSTLCGWRAAKEIDLFAAFSLIGKISHISSISLFLICRFGKVDPARGRQTLCKFYDNEILNEQLQRIKSAQTVDEFEKLLQEQLRRQQGFTKSAKSIQPYYDSDEILRNKTCLSEQCERQTYRFDGNQLLNENRDASSSSSVPLAKPTSRSYDYFAYAAAECYEKCISVYLNDLSASDRRVERERQSILSHIDYSIPLKLRQVFDDSSLANQVERIKISFESLQPVQLRSPRQSIHIPRVRQQTMSSNESNNNRDESTTQVKDPPEIVLSDHSTNQNIKQDTTKSYSDSDQVIDKNNCYLSVPIGHFYSSEARPPWKKKVQETWKI